MAKMVKMRITTIPLMNLDLKVKRTKTKNKEIIRRNQIKRHKNQRKVNKIKQSANKFNKNRRLLKKTAIRQQIKNKEIGLMNNNGKIKRRNKMKNDEVHL